MIISSIGNWKVMGIIKIGCISGFQFKIFLGILFSVCIYSMIKTIQLNIIVFYGEVIAVLLLFLYFCGIKYIFHHNFLLKNNININNKYQFFANIISLIPSVDEMVLLEEEAVVYLKDINGVLSNRFNCAVRFITCGSLSEGFGVPLVNDWISDIGRKINRHPLLTDQDFFIEPSEITASYSSQSDTIEIVQSNSFIEEGYALLRVSGCMAGRFEIEEGFLSTDKIKHSVKQCISKNLDKLPGVNRRVHPCCYEMPILFLKEYVYIHGPAINVRISTFQDEIIYLADFTFAIPCLKWPPESDWPSRNKMWPDHRVVTTIKDLGFHFVPKNQKNDKSKLTWRYSFSLVERELSKQVNEVARICFLCLKIINVAHLKPICKRLNSYHLKTVLFRTLEVTSAEMWSETNILNCLDYLIKELQEAFHQERCMHFWISRINLFRDFNHRQLSKLEEKIKEISKNPFYFLFTYSLAGGRRCCPAFRKNEKQLFCFCFRFLRDDLIMRTQLQNRINNRIRNSMSEEAATREGNHVIVSIEEAPLITDSYPECSYGSFSQNENQ